MELETNAQSLLIAPLEPRLLLLSDQENWSELLMMSLQVIPRIRSWETVRQILEVLVAKLLVSLGKPLVVVVS